MYKIAREYDGLIDPIWKSRDAEKDYGQWSKRKVSHILSQNNFRGFEEEVILDYKLRSVMVFDACPVHASVLEPYEKPEIHNWLKNGINIQFYLEHENNT